jgi:hypothetical protein
MQPLTYLAQVRQLPSKSGRLYRHLVPITLPFSRTKRSKRVGMSHREIVTIGIVPDAVWVEQSKSTGAWSTVVVLSPYISRYISSRSLVGERK